MTDRNTQQLTWQSKILLNLPSSANKFKHLFDKPSTWWHNPTNPNSLRITKFAWTMIGMNKHGTFNFVKFELANPILPKTLVQLERHFTAPYYIHNLSTIYCLGDTEILMLSLHANNLQQYLDNQTS